MKSTLKISGMTCEGCKSAVHGKLSMLDGVDNVQVDLAKGKAVNYEGATGVEFTEVGEAFGSFLEKEIKGGKFKTKKQR